MLEDKIARLSALAGDAAAADSFAAQARARGQAIRRILWSEATGAFVDYDWSLERPRENLTAAALVPLFAAVATPAQAARSAQTARARLLMPGGIATTELQTGEQWDQPNGWAPLQWMSVAGLRAYGQARLADDIARRWLATVGALYRRESKLVEKYALHEVSGGGGGEYPLQDGFGWTNGVTRRLLELYPAINHPGDEVMKVIGMEAKRVI
jgi:alpha,alpha-trehalase